MLLEILHQMFLSLTEYAFEEFFGEFTDLGFSQLDKFANILYMIQNTTVIGLLHQLCVSIVSLTLLVNKDQTSMEFDL